VSNEQHNQDDDLEFNDGLGDLLREKEKHRFSWLKTVLVMGVLVALILLVLVLIFSVAKSFLVKTPDPSSEVAFQQLQKVEKDLELADGVNTLAEDSSSKNAAQAKTPTAAATPKTQDQVKPVAQATKQVPAPAAQVSAPLPTPPKPVVAPKVVAPKPAPTTKPARVVSTSKEVAKSEVKSAKKVTKSKKTQKVEKQKHEKAKANKKQEKHTVATSPKSGTPFKVVVGHFSSAEQVKETKHKLQDSGYFSFTASVKNSYSAQVGAFKTQAEAQKLVSSLKAKGFSAKIVQK